MNERTNPETIGAKARPYHHGDLATALMDAGEQELTEKGIEGFSLRGVAKRAGVSHSAPAHHFRDVNGLLTALATRGFENFVRRQRDYRQRANPDLRAQLAASGVGYVAFARENPALFRLMFGSDRPEFHDAKLENAAEAAFLDLVTRVTAVTGASPSQWEDRKVMTDIAATWAIAHGLADLLAAGRFKGMQNLDDEARDRMVAEIVARALP